MALCTFGYTNGNNFEAKNRMFLDNIALKEESIPRTLKNFFHFALHCEAYSYDDGAQIAGASQIPRPPRQPSVH